MKELCMWKSQKADLKLKRLNFWDILFNLIKLRRTLRKQKQSETDWHLKILRKYKSF